MKPTYFTDGVFGWAGLSVNIVQSTLALNAVGTWGAFSFYLKSGQTLTNLHIYLGKTGTVNAGGVRVDIYSDSAGSPSSSLANVSNSGTLVDGWNDFTFNLALTAQTQYWVVIRNLAATPSSNFPTMRWSAGGPSLSASASSIYCWGKKNSTDSGVTWAGTIVQNIIPFFRLDFSGSVYGGLPVESIAADNTNVVFSTRELGLLFTTPAQVKLAVCGVSMTPSKTGTPTGNYRYRIYKGTTLVATSQEVVAANIIASAEYVPAFFSSTVVLEANTAYRVVMAEATNSDTSSNCYKFQFYTFENTVTSLGLKPLGGTAQKTYFNGSSWTETATDVCPINLILDQDQMFYPVANAFAYY